VRRTRFINNVSVDNFTDHPNGREFVSLDPSVQLDDVIIDHNCFYRTEGDPDGTPLVRITGQDYTANQLADLAANSEYFGPNNVVTDPVLAPDGALAVNSPLINKGTAFHAHGQHTRNIGPPAVNAGYAAGTLTVPAGQTEATVTLPVTPTVPTVTPLTDHPGYRVTPGVRRFTLTLNQATDHDTTFYWVVTVP